MTPVKLLPALTSIRGFAAWWVVVFHFRFQICDQIPAVLCATFAQGFLAVDLFFVLSGFVIFLNYGASVRTFSAEGIRRFALARVARIYPLHGVISLLFLSNPLAIMLFSRNGTLGDQYDFGYYALSLLLLQNWGFTDHLAWNHPAWSISTEWFVYLIFPLMAFAAFRFHRSAGQAAVTVLVGLGLLAALFAGAGEASIGGAIPRLGLLRCLLEFIAGVGICQIYLFLGPLEGRAHGAALAGFFGLTGLGIGLGLPDFLVMPAAFACLILALTSERAPVVRVLRSPLLLYLGNISYSTYLVHFLVRDWIKFVLVGSAVPAAVIFGLYLAATLAMSILLYHAVELPGRRLVRALAGGDREQAGGGPPGSSR